MVDRWSELRVSVEESIESAGLDLELLAPWVDEYIAAWRSADVARAQVEALPYSAPTAAGRVYANPAHRDWDVAVKRAMRLADLLGLTPRARKRLGLSLVPEEPDEFADLDAAFYGHSEG